METDRHVGSFATQIRQQLDQAIGEQLDDPRFSSVNIFIRYVPILMDLEPQYMREKFARTSQTKRTIDHAPILNYEPFRANDRASGASEMIRELLGVRKALTKLSGGPTLAVDFETMLEAIKPRILSPNLP